jgi:glycosyltransferase involved in cell wall biosynthesis
MKIYTHNFNPNSNSGPNKFCRTLFESLIKDEKVTLAPSQKDADVEFCLIQQQAHKVKPMLLRLDGIWFNSEQDYNTQNAPIRFAYGNASAVVFQSNFNKKLTEHWFGTHPNSFVVHNAANEKLIANINKNFWLEKLNQPGEIWCCASSWRPHKRLKDNIEYFLEFAPDNAILAVAGKDTNIDNLTVRNNKRIFFLGELDYLSLLSLYKASTTFIHLAYLDHCPNVVVDAQASGCHIVCSSTGGTKEVVHDGTVILEDDWDFRPIPLYKPPKIDFGKFAKLKLNNRKNSMELCSKNYYEIMKGIL